MHGKAGSWDIASFIDGNDSPTLVIVGSDPRSLAVGESKWNAKASETRKQVKRFAEPKMSSPHALHHNHNLELYKIDK
jgi:hypothetical protein